MAEELRIKSSKKLNATRRFIAGKMAESLKSIPQVTAMFDLASGKVLEQKDVLKAQDPNVTVTAVLVRLVATVLQAYPIVNSAVIDGQLVQYDSVNIAVGVGLEKGIMTLVIKEAQDKSVFEIAREMKEKTELIKTGQLPLEDMKGSTFTISSIGVQGLRYSTVVINPPEVAMLAIGVTEKKLVVQEDDTTTAQFVTSFAITHDHTVLDGYHVGEFVRLLRERMENPQAYLGL